MDLGSIVKTYLSVSDLHIGSLYGLFPEGVEIPVENGIGSIWKLNEFQKYLLPCWNDLIFKRLPKKVDVICLGGDLIDGLQGKGFGQLVTDNIDVQVNACIKLLEPLSQKTDHLFVIAGTSYHESEEEKRGAEIAKSLGGEYKGLVLNARLNGKRINDKHFISTSQGIYTSGVLDKEGLWARIASPYIGKTDIIIRHHIHEYHHAEHGSLDIITTPGFQVQTPYAMTRNYFRWRPDIGAVLLHIGNERIYVEKIIYPHLVSKEAVVEID